jgi:hypothetical protein
MLGIAAPSEANPLAENVLRCSGSAPQPGLDRAVGTPASGFTLRNESREGVSRPQTSSTSPLKVPSDLLEEIGSELESSRCLAVRHIERLSALAELQREAAAAIIRLRRPITIFDLVELAADEGERRRVAALVSRLRSDNES